MITGSRRIVFEAFKVKGCPLYTEGGGMLYFNPEIRGAGTHPVCGLAVQRLLPTLQKIWDGKSPDKFSGTSCGGCAGAEAWFRFRIEDSLPSSVVMRLSPETIHALGNSWLFAGLKPTDIENIQSWLKESKIAKGTVLIRRGEVTAGMYIVVRGRFEILDYDPEGNTSVITRVGPGETLGEISSLTGEPATASVRAAEDCVVCRINRERLPQLGAMVPGLIWGLARLLASRVVKTTARLTQEINQGMRGQLEAIPPAHLVQAICVSNTSGRLTVESGNRRFSMHFVEGRVGDMRVGNQEGPEAFYEFLSWHNGHFRFEPGRRDDLTATADAMALMLEGLRRLDEETKARGLKSFDSPPVGA